jgi:predicted ABC-type ATPase
MKLPPSFGMNSVFSAAKAMWISENNKQKTLHNFLCNIVVDLVSLAGEQIKWRLDRWRK